VLTAAAAAAAPSPLQQRRLALPTTASPPLARCRPRRLRLRLRLGAVGAGSSATPTPTPDDQSLPEGLSELQDLVDRGVLRVWRRSASGGAPGARGSGHSRATSRSHEEPDEIFVVGTAHVSPQSAADVDRVISAVRPDNVVVELCKSRAGVMADIIPEENRPAAAGEAAGGAESEDRRQGSRLREKRERQRLGGLGVSGDGFRESMARTLELGGVPALLLRAAMATGAAAIVSKETGGGPPSGPRRDIMSMLSDSGVDFRAARRAAERVGAQIVLGDRPLEITLERAWDAMAPREKWSMLSMFASSGSSPLTTGELQTDVMRALSEEGSDLLEAYESILRSRIPNLLTPLITERDIFLSLSMKSSLAVNGCNRVVGVVGRAHLPGVMRALNEDHSGEFKSLTYTPRRAAMKQKILGIPKPLAQRLAFDVVVGVLAYLVLTASQN